MTTSTAHRLPMILDEVEVTAVERLSTSFVRVELGGSALADFGVDGPTYDQRIKLVLPDVEGRLPSFEGVEESWLGSFLAMPEDERGAVRTYTVRAVRGNGADTRLVVDVVLHLAEGATGPGSRWASTVRPGDRVIVLAPRRGVPFGGIEFVPGAASRVLLVADETAVPAVGSILEQWPAGLPGRVSLEVPTADDVLDLVVPVGVEVVWMPRAGAPHGACLVPAVRRHLGLEAPQEEDLGLVAESAVDPDLWETPTWSSSGEPLPDAGEGAGLDGLYAWIAGESRVVTTLRRCLVTELGVDRRQVAFMGYWREGVAMRS